MIVVLVGAVFFPEKDQRVLLSSTQVWLIVVALSGAQIIARHPNTRRYVTGILLARLTKGLT
jgi:hypothetical protein